MLKRTKRGVWGIGLAVLFATSVQAVTVEVLDEGISNSLALGAPTVGIDGIGNALAAWEYQFTDPGELYTARYDTTGGWGPKALLDTSAIGDRVFLSVVAVNENGIGLLAWTGQKGIYASTFLPGGSWQPPQVIASGDTPFSTFATHLQLGIDSAGNGVLVWDTELELQVFSSQYNFSTDTWTLPEVIGDRRFARSALSLAVSPGGNAVLLWEHWNFILWTLYASSFIAGQGWQAPEVVYTSNFGHRPHVTINDGGEAVAVWVDSVFPNTSLYAARFIPGQGWQPTEGLSVNNPNRPADPKVALNSSGNAIVVWRHAFDFSIAADRYIAGDGWQGVEVLKPLGTGGDPTVLRPHIDDQGNIVVLWDPTLGAAEIEMKRFDPSQGWLDTEGLLFMGNKGPVSDVDFAINASGKSVIVWREAYDICDPLCGTFRDILTAYGFVIIAGDLDRDGDVDRADRDIFVGSLLSCTGDESFVAETDYNGNGCTDFDDYLTWYRFFKAFAATPPSPGGPPRPAKKELTWPR
ncbi:MAG: hypothetical protein O7E52_26865 [Candidatus Poribacteria bacterium]|nr:hypothetical protein [Candidatus Poribacteria bacterium]